MRDVREPPGILKKITATDRYPKRLARGHLRVATRGADVWDRHGNAPPQEGPPRAGDRGPPAPLPALSQAASGARPRVRSRLARLVPAVCSVLPLGSPGPPRWDPLPRPRPLHNAPGGAGNRLQPTWPQQQEPKLVWPRGHWVSTEGQDTRLLSQFVPLLFLNLKPVC